MRTPNKIIRLLTPKRGVLALALVLVGPATTGPPGARAQGPGLRCTCLGTELIVRGFYRLPSNRTYTCVTLCDGADFHTGLYTLTVLGPGGLTVMSNGYLQVDGPGGAVVLTGGGRHAIDGEISLRTSAATLKIRDTSGAVLTGDGKIIGRDNDSRIHVASVDDAVELTSDIRITGHLTISGDGDFTNDGHVTADSVGTLDVALSGTVADTPGSDRWEVSARGAELRFSTSAHLQGDITVKAGTLKVADAVSVCTTGAFSHTGGHLVLRGDGVAPEASFKRSPSCPE